MTPDERQLMGQVAERYPQREIAATLGIAPSAARVRIHRLRERLARVAAAYIGALPLDEGLRLARFLETPRGRRARATVPGAERTTDSHAHHEREGRPPGDEIV